MVLSRWENKYLSIAESVIDWAVHLICLQSARITRDICTVEGIPNYAFRKADETAIGISIRSIISLHSVDYYCIAVYNKATGSYIPHTMTNGP